MKTDSIERVEEFKYLGTTLTNQNSNQEEIKCCINQGDNTDRMYLRCCPARAWNRLRCI